jgi:hypothetical protein
MIAKDGSEPKMADANARGIKYFCKTTPCKVGFFGKIR